MRWRQFFSKWFFGSGALLLGGMLFAAEPGAELIEKGDVFDRKLLSAPALEYYLPAEILQPSNGSLLVRIARQYRHQMSDAPTREEKLRLGGVALSYSNRAAALGPKDSEAQLAIAITYGKLLPFLERKEQVQASSRIKDSVDKALKLDPRNDTAWHILGRWHRALADVGAIKRRLGSLLYGKLPSSTNEAAADCFERAYAINPNRLMHSIELGRTYLQMGRTEDARRFLTKGLAMPEVEKDDPETKRSGWEALGKLR